MVTDRFPEFAIRNRQVFTQILLSFFCLALTLVPAYASSNKPNVLFILTDNTGWGDYGCYGGGVARGAPTPNIDQLADEGLRLTNFNTEAQCTPSRSALMTGRFSIRSGTYAIPVGVRKYGLVPWEQTMAESFSEAGYATAIYGKWHLGQTPGRFPTDQGFDEWYGIPNTDESAWIAEKELVRYSTIQDARDIHEYYDFTPWLMEAKRGEEPKKLKVYDMDERRLIDGEITRRAIDFMRRNARAKKPFFAYVPMLAMHFPVLPHPDFEGKSGYGYYTDLLMQTDHYLGQMLEALDDLGIAENTIVVFCADNGPEHPANGDGEYTGWTGPWRGTYFTAMEGGIRAPFIVRWKNHIPAGRVSDDIVHIVDMFPTLAGLAGAKARVPKDRAIDGKDHSDFFLGKSAKSAREEFSIYVGKDLTAWKWRKWKVHFVWQPTKYDPRQPFSTIPRVINLVRDPREERQDSEPFNGYLQYAMAKHLAEFRKSLQEFPSVPMDAPDDWTPER